MGKSVLGARSSFIGQIQVAEADIKSRGTGRNTTFPGMLTLDDVLARLNALESPDQGGALAIKCAAPLYKAEVHRAGRLSYPSILC